MPPRPIIPAQLPLEKRRSQIDRVTNATGDTFRVSYRIGLDGSGETTVTVNFPVQFSERPTVSSGGELHPEETLVAGNYPWWSVGVADWITEDLAGRTYYVGADLVIVCGGPTGQLSYAHFTAEGKALQHINDAD